MENECTNECTNECINECNNNETRKIIFNNKKNNKKNRNHNENKKRVETLNWKFDLKYYEYENQINIIQNIQNNKYKYYDDISKLCIQQINKKIYSYKHQDILKNLFDENKFINFKTIIDKIMETKLKCYYCNLEMNILYDISREIRQWSVDRINNEFGHNCDNFYLACLNCNLKRRRTNDVKYFFTKNLNLVKL